MSGSVIAEQASSRSGFKSLVIDKRNHIGGNCYDFIDDHGIRVSKYGAHIFHTKYERVWNYVQKFSEWLPYQHRVKGKVKDCLGAYKIVPIPPNQVDIFIMVACYSIFMLNIARFIFFPGHRQHPIWHKHFIRQPGNFSK